MTIMSMLTPRDILNLKYLSKALDIASRQRWVWLQVLPDLLSQNNLFVSASFLGSASGEMLERLATASLRLPRVMAAALQHRRSPLAKVKLAARKTTSFRGFLKPMFLGHAREKTPQIALLPGGKYLLVDSPLERRVKLVRLNGTSATEITALALPEKVPYRLGDWQILQGGNTLRIVIIAEVIRQTMPCVYDLSFDDVFPIFRLRKELGVVEFMPYDQVQVALGDDIVVCADHQGLAVYGIAKSHLRQRWVHNTGERETLSMRMHVVGDYIVIGTHTSDVALTLVVYHIAIGKVVIERFTGRRDVWDLCLEEGQSVYVGPRQGSDMGRGSLFLFVCTPGRKPSDLFTFDSYECGELQSLDTANMVQDRFRLETTAPQNSANNLQSAPHGPHNASDDPPVPAHPPAPPSFFHPQLDRSGYICLDFHEAGDPRVLSFFKWGTFDGWAGGRIALTHPRDSNKLRPLDKTMSFDTQSGRLAFLRCDGELVVVDYV